MDKPMKRPAVSSRELWAAQAQFGPFGNKVIKEILDEWDRWLIYQGLKPETRSP